MICLVNFADKNYHSSQVRNSQTGMKIGGFDKVFSFTPDDIPKDFFSKYEHILSNKRGSGYWLWKPLFVKTALDRVAEGDYVFWCDAGADFIANINSLIDFAKEKNIDVLPFESQFLEKQYTKRDAFIIADLDVPEIYDSKHRICSFFLIKKTKLSVQFIEEFLSLACDERMITDSVNQLGKENYPEFIEHRHDQSIFSLLTKKYKFIAFRDPSQWGNMVADLYKDSTYPQILSHHRKKNLTKNVIINSFKNKLKKLTGRA